MYKIWLSMKEFLQRDLSSSLLSISVLLGWLGISFVFLRILAITIKKILEAVFKNSNQWWKDLYLIFYHNYKYNIGIITHKWRS